MPDLLTDFGNVLRQEAVSESIIERVIDKLRQRYGGDRVFIPKIDRLTRNQRIVADLQQGLPLKQVANKRGCSFTTVRRISQEWNL